MSRFRANPFFEREMKTEPRYRAGLHVAAEVIAAHANNFAPRIMPRGSKAIEVQTDGTEVVVANTDHGGHLAEFGSINNPPYAPIRRGVAAAGARLREQ